ncbi:HupE/UreJ family protein [Candidatus Albibeggiatoa sp. nov. NOAA]|uniref:HupE/UreJ family protein n=1 Tax=Candidatus Albibeggiatoa sp. nov. NOAA TaxID=3162724 RepID=UPI003305120E|nr:HupE/UreJ family protein [Thiotrichaceae bacterium]
MKKSLFQLCSLVLVGLLPMSVYAHHPVEMTGFAAGTLHPLTGLDHLLAMVAVGLWASQIGKKALWTLPSSFIIAMVLGALLPIMGVAIPYVETGILLSVLVLGGLVATALPMAFSIAIVSCFAVFHGYAHGAETSALSASYIAGFVLSTAILQAMGVMTGVALRQLQFEKITRFAGSAIAMTGMYFVFA